jgi:D-cysteine desulfhydrase family pyridoxal phosphate-dependent enzyme
MECFAMTRPEKISLGLYPTALYRLPNLSQTLGTNVWVKRDDLCGVALGGNKVRKLEYLLCQAKSQGYDLVMTTGGAQSNHAMLTAACALRLGMEPVLVLKKRGVCSRRGNQVLNHLMGAEVRFIDTDSYDDIYEQMDVIAAEKGRPAYKIPCGGSNALGAVGYVDCMEEIASSGVRFDHVVCPCGSGGTAAGVLLGGSVYMPQTHITIAKVDSDDFESIVPDLATQTAQLLGIETPAFNGSYLEMTGPGYAIPSPEGNEAISLMLRQEGIVLDTCYTGKAFAGLVKLAREGAFKPEDNVLFIHTGGAGGLFAPDWEN